MADHIVDVTDPLEPRPPRRQTLGYSRKPLPDHIFAVVRLSWFKEGRPQEVDEFQIVERTNNSYEAFMAAVTQAIQCGADVTVMCDLDPAEFGLD
jgi:hypothetical protein